MNTPEPQLNKNTSQLQQHVEIELTRYFNALDDLSDATSLHKMVMDEVEAALLRFVMTKTNGNQSMAAGILGINRNTLRKKLTQYDLI